MGTFFFLNFLVGLGLALTIRSRRIGCLALLPLCIASVVQVSRWQAENADKLTSTSGLEYLFSFVWPGLAGIVGLAIGRALRELLFKRR